MPTATSKMSLSQSNFGAGFGGGSRSIFGALGTPGGLVDGVARLVSGLAGVVNR
jgi:hypothetical protein